MSWKGYNVHAYTPEYRKWAVSHIAELEVIYGSKLESAMFTSILNELSEKYGHKVTYSNFRNAYDFKTGWITDPELPGLNCAILLRATWEKVKLQKDESLYKHFGETLDQIGTTCLQGVSHRLLQDYWAFSDIN